MCATGTRQILAPFALSRSNFLRTPDGTAEASSDDAKMRRVEAVKPPVSFADLQAHAG